MEVCEYRQQRSKPPPNLPKPNFPVETRNEVVLVVLQMKPAAQSYTLLPKKSAILFKGASSQVSESRLAAQKICLALSLILPSGPHGMQWKLLYNLHMFCKHTNLKLLSATQVIRKKKVGFCLSKPGQTAAKVCPDYMFVLRPIRQSATKPAYGRTQIHFI